MLVAIIKQSGGGCDHTIECGTKVIYCGSDQSPSAFINEVMSDYGPESDWDAGDIETLQIFSVTPVLVKPVNVVKEWVIDNG